MFFSFVYISRKNNSASVLYFTIITNVEMSSSTLTTIQNQLNLYGYSIFMILGNIGNVFIVIIFSRQRQNACSIYLISSAVVNIVYLTFNGIVSIFPFIILMEQYVQLFSVKYILIY